MRNTHDFITVNTQTIAQHTAGDLLTTATDLDGVYNCDKTTTKLDRNHVGIAHAGSLLRRGHTSGQDRWYDR